VHWGVLDAPESTTCRTLESMQNHLLTSHHFSEPPTHLALLLPFLPALALLHCFVASCSAFALPCCALFIGLCRMPSGALLPDTAGVSPLDAWLSGHLEGMSARADTRMAEATLMSAPLE